MNYDLLIELVNIPDGLDRSIKKEKLTKELRSSITDRDELTCQICGLTGKYGNPGYSVPGKLAIHHIIPNGKSDLDNLITLCRYCHNAVHQLLYSSGKWRYVPMR